MRETNPGLAGGKIQAEGVQFRLVGEIDRERPGFVPAAPGLEDGYVWLMTRPGRTPSGVPAGS